MVDSTADIATANTDAPDLIRMDQSHIAAEVWSINILALIKLRSRGTTKVTKLPSGVFRCILEYQFPNLLWRYSDPYLPIKKQHDRHFPTIDKLDYENYIVAVTENFYTHWHEYKFTLRDGANCGTKSYEKNW